MNRPDDRGLRRIEHADLRARNTFGVAARAPLLFEVDDVARLPDLFAAELGADAMVLGGGSNLLFAADPQSAMLVLAGDGIRVRDDDGETAIVRAEAGLGWHHCVLWTLQHGLSGLQNLALIPGTVGAAPIQNIGAYGVEVGECVHAVEAYDRRSGTLRRLSREDCRFAYRDSRFKREADAWVVTAVEFALSRGGAVRTDYAGLGDELLAMGVHTPAPREVAEAVIRIRRRKLPNPAKIGNAGSFFKNPIVAAATADALRDAHPGLPVYPVAAFPADAAAHAKRKRGSESLLASDARSPDTTGERSDSDPLFAACKLSAAWLIDQCGWKGRRDGDAGVSDRHALVLVNHGAATGAQLLDLARRVAASVQERFGVMLEPEPRIVGATW